MMRIYKGLFLVILFSLAIILNACRPPELEQAVIEYNAGRYENAYEQAKAATEKYPENEEAWYYRGEVEGRMQKIEDMMSSFQKSLAIKNTFAGEIEVAKKNYFGKFYNDGVSSYNSLIKVEDKTSPEAKKAADKVIENFKNALLIMDDYMATRLIAVVSQMMDDKETSLKYFILASESQPDTVTAWTDLGYYYQRQKDFLKAAEEFKKGLEIDPKNEECLIRYAESLDLADKKEEAIAAYKQALELIPNEKAIPFNLGLLIFKLSTTPDISPDKKKELMAESAKYFEQAHQIDPEIKETYDLLGTLLLQLGEFDKAKKLLEQGVEIFPDSPSIWQNLSFLYAKTGDKKKAEEAFSRSKQLKGE
jgi:tetratricopeptide (TPR) repeat protein